MDFSAPFFREMDRQLVSMTEQDVIEAISISPCLFEKDLLWCTEITDVMAGEW